MAAVIGATLLGVEGIAIEVEVRITSQLPRIDVVGLPSASVRESAARVRSAITASGHPFPQQRVVVNLAPAELRKQSAALDLPIAIGVLSAAGALPAESLDGIAFVGELALDGRLRPIRGALALCVALQRRGCRRAVVPLANAREASLAPDLEVFAARDLAGVAAWLAGSGELEPPQSPVFAPQTPCDLDLGDVRGQQHAKRALEIAAVGGHALLLRGPPGCGKTMLARRLPGLLPPPSFEESLASTQIHGAAGLLDETTPLVQTRPFRAPHHTASTAGILGGGNPPRPGEVSLAHTGVLFLDELPEFQRATLEALRQVVEEQRVVIARARMSCSFPAQFHLVAAANPCPCGWHGSERRDCRCDVAAIARYGARISGPLLDRIDLHASVRSVPWRELAEPATGGGSENARARVAAARMQQEARNGAGLCNAALPDAALDARVDATPEARALLGRAVEQFALSARAARRILKVARSIADLAGERRCEVPAVAEALGYRPESDPR